MVLVNNNRTYGEWAKAHGNSALDEGVATTVTVKMAGVTRVTDEGTGGDVPIKDGEFTVELEPGWGSILKLGAP